MLKKQILSILIASLTFSCVQNENYLITNTSIGKFKLIDTLTETYDKEIFDFKLDSENRITTIITYSNKFKTKDNFRVGSNFEDIKKVKGNDYEGEITMTKGDRFTGSFGKTIFYNNILFIDTDEDNSVDMVLISAE